MESIEGACQQCGTGLQGSIGWCQVCLTPIPGAAGAPPTVAGHDTTASTPPALNVWSPAPGFGADAAFIPAYEWPGATSSEPKVGRSAVFLALGVIVLNFVVQVATYAVERTDNVQPDTAITVGLWVGILFYGVVVYMALRNRAAAVVRPRWTRGNPALAWIGVAVGAVGCFLVLGLQEVMTHRAGDSTAQLIVSDGSITRIAMAFLAMAVIAPVVEEFVFRGILAEALRTRGLAAATLISAFLFAVAHLRLHPANLLYYTVVGSMLAQLYFRFGLKASILAHATFNGLLTFVAVFNVLGPSNVFTVDGAVLQLPAAWHSVKVPDGFPYQLAIEGPSASGILVLDKAVPPGVPFDPEAAQRSVEERSIAAGETITSDEIATYPAGQAVVIHLVAEGHPGEAVIMSSSGHEWIFILSTAGSAKAQSDFNHMLKSFTLPRLAVEGAG